MKTKEEHWDDYSTHVDSDIDSLQMIAGTSIVTKADFLKAMQTYSDQQNAELVEALKELLAMVNLDYKFKGSKCKTLTQAELQAEQVLQSHTNRP